MREGLIDAYGAAEYVVFGENAAFTMRVGQFCEELARLFETSGYVSAAFITAFNPFSEPHSDDFNRHANLRLLQELRQVSFWILEGCGQDPQGVWKPEHSYLVFGIAKETAAEIGQAFRQNAALWASSDAKPELLVLAPLSEK